MRDFSVMSALAIFAFMLMLSGCASMSGLDAKSSFACKAPDGILCESMSGVYANAQAHNLPGQLVKRRQPGGISGSSTATARSGVGVGETGAGPSGMLSTPISSGTPIRSAPRMLRIWLAPWEDSDGDLHDQSYIYVSVDAGRWLIEHNQDQIEETFRPRPSHARQALQPPRLSASESSSEVRLPVRQADPRPESVETLDNGEEVMVGVRQDRLPLSDAVGYMNGIRTPGDPARDLSDFAPSEKP